jgi:hypothetical protein
MLSQHTLELGAQLFERPSRPDVVAVGFELHPNRLVKNVFLTFFTSRAAKTEFPLRSIYQALTCLIDAGTSLYRIPTGEKQSFSPAC